jgi:DNA-directed RNA polymerase beta subunit
MVWSVLSCHSSHVHTVSFFTTSESKGRTLFGAKIIPARGAWVEIESEADGVIYVKIDRKRSSLSRHSSVYLVLTKDKDMIETLQGMNVLKST